MNVKATTEEGLGFTGTGRGISSQAVCLLNTPYGLYSQDVNGGCSGCGGCPKGINNEEGWIKGWNYKAADQTAGGCRLRRLRELWEEAFAETLSCSTTILITRRKNNALILGGGWKAAVHGFHDALSGLREDGRYIQEDRIYLSCGSGDQAGVAQAWLHGRAAKGKPAGN